MKTIYLMLILIFLVACENNELSNNGNLIKELEEIKSTENQKLELIKNQKSLMDFESGKKINIINKLENQNIKIDAIRYDSDEKIGEIKLQIKIENLSDQMIDLYGLEFIAIDQNNNEYPISGIQMKLMQPIKPKTFIFGILTFEDKEIIELKNLKIFSRFDGSVA